MGPRYFHHQIMRIKSCDSACNNAPPLHGSSNGKKRTKQDGAVWSEKQSKTRKIDNMPLTKITGSFSSPKVDLIVDMGNPFLNLTVDGFLKIGTVAAAKVAAEETYHVLRRGSVSHHNFEHSLKKMCKEGAAWGAVAGVYVGMEYGVERIRGTRDWKNAMIGGALTGALVSAASNKNRDKIVLDAIAGGAVATAAEFLNYLT